MPPKKEERKPLEPLFQISDPFYMYRPYDNAQLEQINHFLTYFKPELTQLLKANIYDNMEMLSKNIGVHLHPCFRKPIVFDNFDDFDENTKFRNPEQDDENESKEPTLIQVQTAKLDACTIKLLDFCCGPSNISNLKLSNNSLTPDEWTIMGQLIVNPENKIKKLFIDWNHVTPEFLKIVPSSPALEFLTLRCCNLTDLHIDYLCGAIKTLKCLDLYDNHLSKEALNLVGKMLQSNASMEFLGLAKNGITSFEDLVGITQNIGKFIMTAEEVEEYRAKEKERDAIIERNKKVKKKGTEEPVPVLEPIVQIDNNFYIVRNSRLWLINLSMNFIDDISREAIEKFLLQTNENFQLVLTSNRFEDQKALQKTKKKFGKKLVI